MQSSVFKRFEVENLWQLTCADMVERMNLSVFLSLNVARNFFELVNNDPTITLPALAIPLLSVATESLPLPSFALPNAMTASMDAIRTGSFAGVLDTLESTALAALATFLCYFRLQVSTGGFHLAKWSQHG